MDTLSTFLLIFLEVSLFIIGWRLGYMWAESKLEHKIITSEMDNEKLRKELDYLLKGGKIKLDYAIAQQCFRCGNISPVELVECQVCQRKGATE